jgi:small subunit ribosomal protein S20
MPIIKSAIKKVRKDRRRAVINRRWRGRERSAVKATRQNPTPELLKAAQKELDKAAKKGVIKKGKASRLKSRLSKLAHARR